MPFSYKDWILGGKTFCCCLPVRFGVITMSVLGILVAGLLSIALWFEVSVSTDMAGGERAAFVIAGLVETLLFAGSILGFVGAIVRKQTFLQTYAYFLYVHFFLNIGAAVYLFVMVSRFQDNAKRIACGDTITNAEAQEQCNELLRVAGIVFIVVTAVVLFLEMYGAIIVTRYLNLVKKDKRLLRESKRATDNAFSLRQLDRSHYEVSGESQIYAPLHTAPDEEFDPYRDRPNDAGAFDRSRSGTAYSSESSAAHTQEDMLRPPMPIDEGYGGGSWTHTEISTEEKDRIHRAERSSVTIRVEDLTQEEMDRRRADFKSPYGPSTAMQDAEGEGDSLPQYVAIPSPQVSDVTTPVRQHPPRNEPGEPESLR